MFVNSLHNLLSTQLQYCVYLYRSPFRRPGYLLKPPLPPVDSIWAMMIVQNEDYQNCSVLYCVWQLCTVTCTHTILAYYLFMFRCSLYFGLLLECFYHVVPVLFAFVMLRLVSSALSQEIAWKERLWSDLFVSSGTQNFKPLSRRRKTCHVSRPVFKALMLTSTLLKWTLLASIHSLVLMCLCDCM